MHSKYQIISILTVHFFHVTYAFQSESTLYSCLNVKELLAQNRRNISSFRDCNRTRTHNHLVRKQTLNHLAKLPIWLNGRVFVYELSGCEFEANKNIEKLFSKHQLLFLDQANSSYDLSQMLILQYPIPRAFLRPLPFLSNFALAN